MNERSSILLGVNIDHVATIRQARLTKYPEPIEAALIAEEAGADGITAHLREDRRHIQDRDMRLLREIIQTRLNMEMAITDEMVRIAKSLKPNSCCLVPEKRAELTTEGGLDVKNNFEKVKAACQELAAAECEVSIFLDADFGQLDAAKKSGAPIVELHTGCFAEAQTPDQRDREYERLKLAAKYGSELGLRINAGHGLHYHNVEEICRIPEILELNIGHGIIARAVLIGLDKAVKDMKQLLRQAR